MGNLLLLLLVVGGRENDWVGVGVLNRSNPCTAMVEATIQSLSMVPLLQSAPVILVCDGCTQIDSQSPNNKEGKVSAEQAARYAEYIANLQRSSDDEGSQLTRVLVLPEHHGFGFAVRAGLELVETAFVMIVQHDQMIVRCFDLPGVLRALTEHAEAVKYVGLCSQTTQHYSTVARGKLGVKLTRTTQYGAPMLPICFWYDKPHVCSTEHYREVVFGEQNPFAAGVRATARLREEAALLLWEQAGPHVKRARGKDSNGIVRRGDFIEETYGRAIRSDMLAQGMAVHHKYGT